MHFASEVMSIADKCGQDELSDVAARNATLSMDTWINDDPGLRQSLEHPRKTRFTATAKRLNRRQSESEASREASDNEPLIQPATPSIEEAQPLETASSSRDIPVLPQRNAPPILAPVSKWSEPPPYSGSQIPKTPPVTFSPGDAPQSPPPPPKAPPPPPKACPAPPPPPKAGGQPAKAPPVGLPAVEFPKVQAVPKVPMKAYPGSELSSAPIGPALWKAPWQMDLSLPGNPPAPIRKHQGQPIMMTTDLQESDVPKF